MMGISILVRRHLYFETPPCISMRLTSGGRSAIFAVNPSLLPHKDKGCLALAPQKYMTIQCTIYEISAFLSLQHRPFARYAKLRVAMHREWWERFPLHRLQRKPLVSDPGMHHGTCVTHVPWRMSGSLTRSGGENVPGIPGACATRNFMYLARGP